MTPIEALIEALRNVRWGRAALKVRAVDAARYHLELARYWHGKAHGLSIIRGESRDRHDRVHSWINKFSVEVLAAAVRAAPFERISEMYESQAIEESGPGEVE